jgi:hypothetical protein
VSLLCELVKDTQVKVRFEVQEEVSKATKVFMENYEEMKSQVVDLTMELEKKQMQIDTGIGIDMDMNMNMDMNMGTDMDKNIIHEKDREIEELNETLNHWGSI